MTDRYAAPDPARSAGQPPTPKKPTLEPIAGAGAKVLPVAEAPLVTERAAGGRSSAKPRPDSLVTKPKKKPRARRASQSQTPYYAADGSKVWWRINPRSNFVRNLDMSMVVALAYVAVVAPFEVAFLEPSLNALFFINRLVDCVFLVDFVKNFCTPFWHPIDMVWVDEPRRVIKNYLCGWFLVDLASVMPFDAVGLAMNDDSLANLKAVRIVRLLRLVKLARIFRTMRLFRRWETEAGISYSKQAAIKFLFIVSFCTHWLACSWRLVALVDDKQDNWLTNYGPLTAASGAWTEYLVCIYWSVTTMSTVGYGDVTAVTDAERFASVIAMVVGASVYANVIGGVCGALGQPDEVTRIFKNNMDELNSYMAEVELEPELKSRLRQYFQYSKFIMRDVHYRSLLMQMSPALRGEVGMHCNSGWVARVPFFNASDATEREIFVVAISAALYPVAYSPQDVIVPPQSRSTTLYIVQRGMVTKNALLMGAGNYFGQDLILNMNISISCVRALTFVCLHALDKDDLMKILTAYSLPETTGLIRKAGLKLALFRKVVRMSGIIRRHRANKKHKVQADLSLEEVVELANQEEEKLFSHVSADGLFKPWSKQNSGPALVEPPRRMRQRDATIRGSGNRNNKKRTGMIGPPRPDSTIVMGGPAPLAVDENGLEALTIRLAALQSELSAVTGIVSKMTAKQRAAQDRAPDDDLDLSEFN